MRGPGSVGRVRLRLARKRCGKTERVKARFYNPIRLWIAKLFAIARGLYDYESNEYHQTNGTISLYQRVGELKNEIQKETDVRGHLPRRSPTPSPTSLIMAAKVSTTGSRTRMNTRATL